MISSITVTYNPNLNILKDQIDSLLLSLDQIIIIDNNSNYETKRFLISLNKEKIFIIFNKVNIGLANAINQGLEKAFPKSDFVILFDHDSIPSNSLVSDILHSYKKLFDLIQTDFILGPKIYDRKLKSCIPFLTKKLLNGEFTEVVHLFSSGTLLSRKVYDRIGNFDIEYFIDQLDVEYCLRAKSLGIKSFGCNSIFLDHSIGDNIKFINLVIYKFNIISSSPLRNYYMVRNMIFLLNSSYPPLSWKFQNTIDIIKRSILWILFLDQKFLRFSYIIQGFRDGLFHKTGKYS